MSKIRHFVGELIRSLSQNKLQILFGFTATLTIFFLLNLTGIFLPPLAKLLSVRGNGRVHYSPVPDYQLPAVLSRTARRREVIGFLPFWNLGDAPDLSYSDLSLIYYFGIPVLSTGNLDKTDPGWSNLKTPEFAALRDLARQHGVRLGLTILNMDQDGIAAFLSNRWQWEKTLRTVTEVMGSYGFSDLDIDFEYIGPTDNKLAQNFTDFVNLATQSVHEQIPGSTVSVATLADSAWKERIYNIRELGQAADNVVIMAYDFNRPGSIAAGPVAPLFGKEKYQYDVYTTVLDYLHLASADKLLLGVPFYGYEWPTVGPAPGAFVLGESSTNTAVSSLKRSLETLAKNSAVLNFDDYSKSPWFSYFDKSEGSWKQVWFENERSLGLKLDLVNQAGLAGIAIWALGYDSPAVGSQGGTLWQTVREKLPRSF